MNIFGLRDDLLKDYEFYVNSFIRIRDQRIKKKVEEEITTGLLWPDPLIQLNPNFEPGESIDELVQSGALHEECSRIFRAKPDPDHPGQAMRLYRHQVEAIHTAATGKPYVLTTGTGSGKSLSYIIPIVNHVLRRGSGRGIQAIVVYPMNALANSQLGELNKFLQHGYPEGQPPVTFARYTGQEGQEERDRITQTPPDILLTNYVMLELILTRHSEKRLVQHAQGLQFLVLDELHTYRGRQGADVALLIRRLRQTLQADDLQCVGTSATMATGGDRNQQKAAVAKVAGVLFGNTVDPAHIIGETLRRATRACDFADPATIQSLAEQIKSTTYQPPTDYERFVADPLSGWIEQTFGLSSDPTDGQLVRANPRSLAAAAEELAKMTGVTSDQARAAIQRQLMASYNCTPNPATGTPPFAFRLHQFIRRGDTIFASLEKEDQRYITLQGQQYVPGDRTRILLPLVCCRECGQEYYCVTRNEAEDGKVNYSERTLDSKPQTGEPGYLYFSSAQAWDGDDLDQYPDDWLEVTNQGRRIRQHRRKIVPEPVQVDPLGNQQAGGLSGYFIPGKLHFCLCCGVAYNSRANKDFSKLANLGTGGRSTATTILSLHTILHLREMKELAAKARKLLSFTDNRQDAALQAGHLNDFVEVALLRSALYKAVNAAGREGLEHDFLSQRVFESLNLPLELYAENPEVRFQALEDTKRALREVIAYRLYQDLRRGWRITAPNLEQCGLLEIDYPVLADVCAAEDIWEQTHPALQTATPEQRQAVGRTLLETMRRSLAIKVNYLENDYQDTLRQRSSQHLLAPWAFDEDEKLEHAAIAFPRKADKSDSKDYGGNIYLSGYCSYAQYLGRSKTFPDYPAALSIEERQTICRDLLEALRKGGLVTVVHPAQAADDVPGYQIPAAALRWKPGCGEQAYHDPIRMPRAPEEGIRTNRFFIELYQTLAQRTQNISAREHTAQVRYDDRQRRENEFREGRLPILYCSPTMELGIDISELNVVNMRNMPPTPANYAQRSGRAGRSGQPALVFVYCTVGSPHDQYFFHHPSQMVSGQVQAPRIELNNQDLIQSHVQAIWLAQSGLSLGKTLCDLLELSPTDDPSLELQPHVKQALSDPHCRERSRQSAAAVLATMEDILSNSDWYTPTWLEEVLQQIPMRFDQACRRWREMYRTASHQSKQQSRIIRDASRTREEKRQAESYRREAERKMELLTSDLPGVESDFYSYRYFASEGFLPGYSFPRLPVTAFIPGRKGGYSAGDNLSRPRFLAISEFGPRTWIYHEGSRYQIERVDLDHSEHNELVTQTVKVCSQCGYLHLIADHANPDLCEHCQTPLQSSLTRLLRLERVNTRRRERINCDEEERARMGYELRAAVRFAELEGRLRCCSAEVSSSDEPLLKLTYGHANIWMINVGWSRREKREQYGFVINVETGRWTSNPNEEDEADPNAPRTATVIPYVEDWRNTLLLEPQLKLDNGQMASLQAALKNAIQIEFLLEDSELAVSALPDSANRRVLAFYESAEGGAGVLRQLVEDPDALPRVAHAALRLCHFDPDSGADLRRAEGAAEDCEAACYDCLLSYGNQVDQNQRLLDRQRIRDVLLQLSQSTVAASAGPAPRQEHLTELLNQADSSLEKRWLKYLEQRGCDLPNSAQSLIPECGTRPDFLYDNDHAQAAIYIDGPPHDFPQRQARDQHQTELLEDRGYLVIRFHHQDQWDEIIARYPGIFGRVTP